MPGKFVSPEDYANISNFMSKYMWLVDACDAEAWGALFTEDAFFSGIPPGTRVGREEVKQIATLTTTLGGKYRHLASNFWIEYGDSTDEVVCRYHALTTIWIQEPVFDNFALAVTHLVRTQTGDGWLIKSNAIQLLNDGGPPDEGAR